MEDTHLNTPKYYEIRVEGHLNKMRAGEFGSMSMNLLPNGQTLISGQILDQAALFGILIRIRDMGVTLVSLTRIDLC
jgi:hypothetical protein